jgi:hypothetical protein
MQGDSSQLPHEQLLDELTTRMEAAIAARGAARSRRFPPGAREWALLAPAWTGALALAAGFPTGTTPDAGPPDVFLEQLAAAQLLTAIYVDPLPDGTQPPPLYVRRDAAHSDLLAEYLARPDGAAELLAWIGQIGRAITAAAVAPDALPATTRLWAALAAAADHPGAAAEVYRQKTAELLAGDSGPNVNAVTNWKTAAEPLADLLTRNLDRSLELALQQTGRQLELLYRESLDRAHLKHFLDRPALTAAFNDLIAGPDEQWALHLVGAGGVGKTMFIRHVAAELARPPQFITARIDFDYLSADYPVRAPGLLLWAFAQEILVHTDESLRSYFNSIELGMREFHATLATGQTNGPATAHPGFQRLVEQYINAFNELPGRLLLIVDTCEELARRVSTGAPGDEDEPETIRETFRILRALHDGPATLTDEQAEPQGGIPDLRVLFSGRWLLAGAGHQWRAHDPAGPARPFLRLYEVQGFSAGKHPRYSGEARAFLEQEQIDPQLVAPIIERLREHSPASAVVRLDEPARRAETDAWRCNPYDLRLYAEWATDDPPPTAATLRTAGPLQYVETRIIRRLKPRELVELLPAVALLGHIDRDLIERITGVERGAADELYAQLRRQEWIQSRRAAVDAPGGETRVLDIDPPMRRRLLIYYRTRPANLQALAERAATALVARTLEADLAGLDWSIVDATLRTLEYLSPERATAWWQDFQARVLRERDPAWAVRITEALIAESGAAGPTGRRDAPESRLRPAVLALHAAALLNGGAIARLRTIWREVATTAQRTPDPALAEQLALFAQAGLISSTDTTPPSQAVQLWQTLADLPAERFGAQAAAAFLSAAEALVEQAEALAEDAADPAGATALIQSADGTLGPLLLHQRIVAAAPAWDAAALPPFAAVLAARAMRVTGNLAEAADLVAARTWLAWRPPADLQARIALEQARLLYPAARSTAATLTITQSLHSSVAATQARSLDGDRYAAAALRLHMTLEPVPRRELAVIEQLTISPRRVAEPAPACRAHRLTPPYLVAGSDALAGVGRIDDALRTLRPLAEGRTTGAREARQHAERALLGLVRRWRLDLRREGGQALLKGAEQPQDLELLRAAEALVGAAPPWLAPPEQLAGQPRDAWLHAVWRTGRAADRAGLEAALNWARTYLAPACRAIVLPPGKTQAHLLFDLHESEAIAHLLGQARTDSLPALPNPAAWAEVYPGEPEAALRIALRFGATEGALSGEDPTLTRLANHLGLRAAAAIAQDEGEMRALRLADDGAMQLLTAAQNWYAACGDQVGVFQVSTARTLLAVRRGDGTGFHAALDAAMPAYVAVQPSEVHRYTHSLEALAQQPDAAVDMLEQIDSYGWRPWVVRLLAALIVRQALARPGLPTARLAQWIRDTYGVPRRDGTVGLPPEFEGWFDELGALSALREPYSPSYRRPVGSSLPPPDRPSYRRPDGPSLPPPDALATRSPSDDADLSDLDAAEVSSIRLIVSGTAEPAVLHDAGLPMHGELLLRAVDGRSLRAIRLDLTTIGAAPYARLAEQLAADLRSTLARIAVAPRPALLAFDIVAPVELQGVCWEALAVTDADSALSRLHIRRRLAEPVALRRPAGGPPFSVSVAPSRTAQSIVSRSGGAFGGRLIALDAFSQLERLERPPAAIRIIHLVGTAERLERGVALRPAGAAETTRQTIGGDTIGGDTIGGDRYIKSNIAIPSNIGGGNIFGGSGLILPHEIRRTCPDLAVCIIQGDPERAETRRRDRDRADAALMRTLASEIQRQGTPIVITIPPVDVGQAETLFRRLFEALMRRQSLGATLSELRQQVVSNDTSENAAERALDVGFLAVDEWETYLAWESTS